MSNLSLDASIRTCKVETGEATRIESDRFLNPNNMICIPWNGQNNKGQRVCADSWMTKRRGCNSAMDRVSVENHLRPDYATYINLNTAGIQGDIYGGKRNDFSWVEAGSANKWLGNRDKLTGNFGNQWQATNYQTCGLNSYERAMSQVQQANRGDAHANNAFNSNANRVASGGCGY